MVFTSALRSLDRISFLKLVYEKKYPPEVVEALLTSYRKSSNRQFESGWRAFQNWLPIDTERVTKSLFLSFMVSLKNKLSYKTALSYRNDLRIPLEEAFQIQTTDKEFDLIAKSNFLHNPPRQKIVPSWNLDNALNSLLSKRFLEDLPKVQGFLAVLFLTAVATGNRSSELANLDKSSISFAPKNSSVTIAALPNFRYKNERASRSPPNIVIPALESNNENRILCPVLALKFLLEKIPFPKKPHVFCNPETGDSLNTSTLSFWLCKAINWLLPDVIPKAHEVRKNAYSLAWARGIPMETITKQGFWSSSSVFIKRYLSKPSSTSIKMDLCFSFKLNFLMQ